jgi:phospholipid/cholesterol/gamma-HCH transport system substrate-binding protein
MIAGARVDIRTGAADIRAGLKDVDEPIRDLTKDARDARAFARKIDEPSPDSGTLSRLVNDSTIYDNIEQITEDVKDFTAGLFKLKTVVGLRAEYNLFALASRAYVSVELWPKPDRFWLIELAADTRSGRMTTTLSVDDNQNLVRRQHFDYPGVRITFQFAKRFDWFTVRAGVKPAGSAPTPICSPAARSCRSTCSRCSSTRCRAFARRWPSSSGSTFTSWGGSTTC